MTERFTYRAGSHLPPTTSRAAPAGQSWPFPEEPIGSPLTLQPEDRHYKSRSDSGAEKMPVCSQ